MFGKWRVITSNHPAACATVTFFDGPVEASGGDDLCGRAVILGLGIIEFKEKLRWMIGEEPSRPIEAHTTGS